MEQKPHNPGADTRSTSDIPQQCEHAQGTPTASATEPQCSVDNRLLEKAIADKQGKFGKTALTTFAKMRAGVDSLDS